MLLTVHIKPNARKNAIEWVDEDTIKASVTAAPQGGKANKALIDLLSDELEIPKSQIEIVRGLTARIKQVRIPFLH